MCWYSFEQNRSPSWKQLSEATSMCILNDRDDTNTYTNLTPVFPFSCIFLFTSCFPLFVLMRLQFCNTATWIISALWLTASLGKSCDGRAGRAGAAAGRCVHGNGGSSLCCSRTAHGKLLGWVLCLTAQGRLNVGLRPYLQGTSQMSMISTS